MAPKKRSQKVSVSSYRRKTVDDLPTNAKKTCPEKKAEVGLLDLPYIVLGSILAFLPDMNAVWRGPGRVSWGFRNLCEHPDVWRTVKINGPKTDLYIMTYQETLVQFVTTKFPHLLRHTKSLEFTGRSVCELTPKHANEIFSTIKSSASPSLRSMTISNRLPHNLKYVTIFDFPPALEHLHLDCEPPEGFFDPLQDGMHDSWPSLKCLRLHCLERSGEMLQQLRAYPIPTLTSLSLVWDESLSLRFRSLLQAIGDSLIHLAISSAISNHINIPAVIHEHCPRLKSLVFAYIHSNSPIGDECIKSLVPTTDGGPGGRSFKDSLEHLTLSSGEHFYFLTTGGIRQLRLLTALKSLSLCTNSTTHEAFRPHIRYILPSVKCEFGSQLKLITTYPDKPDQNQVEVSLAQPARRAK